jgi:hypothetical protein
VSAPRRGDGRATGLALIPAFNEALCLPRVLAELRQRWPGPILVVDDASSDATPDLLDPLARRGELLWLRLSQNLGVGGAMRAGLRYARELGHGRVVRVDGDGQHDPADLERLLQPIREGRADAVQGSRHLPPGIPGNRGLRLAGQRALARSLSVLTGQAVTDPTSGFWAFGPRAVALLGAHHPTGYPEPELRLLLRRNGLRVVEVPVRMRPRLGGRTSLTAGRAGMALARVLLAMVIVPVRGVLPTTAHD